MITSNELVASFRARKKLLDALDKRVRPTLRAFSERNNFAFAARIKSVDSIAEKVETGRFSKFSELDDLCAYTIVIPNRRYEEEVTDFCEEIFDCQIKMVGSSQKRPIEFRFDGTRICCRLKSRDISEPRRGIFGLMFEVQVRTAFEHAWSVSTHDLVYKSEMVDWRRTRLAAQLRAAIEQMDALIIGFDENAKLLIESSWPEIEDLKLISSKVRQWFENEQFPTELMPKDVSRFSENFRRVIRASRRRLAVADAICIVDKWIGIRDVADVPLSMSFFQLLSGVLIEEEAIGPHFERFKLPVTEEMISAFPRCKMVRSTVVFD